MLLKVCLNCNGTGIIKAIMYLTPKMHCPVCNGTGKELSK